MVANYWFLPSHRNHPLVKHCGISSPDDFLQENTKIILSCWWNILPQRCVLCKKTPYSDFYGSYFSAFRLNTEIYSVNLHFQLKCGEKKDQKNSEYEHFSCTRSLNVRCRGWCIFRCEVRYRFFNEAIISNGCSTSIPEGMYRYYGLNFAYLHFLQGLWDYAKRWTTVIIGFEPVYRQCRNRLGPKIWS